MMYGPGASAALWKELFPHAELWQAESDADCVVHARSRGMLTSVNVVIGDQASRQAVTSWVAETGGKLDVVIDDGGHHNSEQQTSFDVLWPHVAPGGLYFIEDLHVSRLRGYSLPGIAPTAAVIKDWYEHMLVPTALVGAMRPPKHLLPSNVSFIFCQAEACVVAKQALQPSASVNCGPAASGIWEFQKMSRGCLPSSRANHYEAMYGIFLRSLWGSNASVKVLDLGLGCTAHGPGARVRLWRTLFPRATLWEADADESCVALAKQRGQLDGVNTVLGDRGNRHTVSRWVTESGGRFDFVIDGGGQSSSQILTSFEVLWPSVVAGGLYFIEDLHMSHHRGGAEQGVPAVVDAIQDWIEQLLIPSGPRLPIVHVLPKQVSFIFCQLSACVIGKSA